MKRAALSGRSLLLYVYSCLSLLKRLYSDRVKSSCHSPRCFVFLGMKTNIYKNNTNR